MKIVFFGDSITDAWRYNLKSWIQGANIPTADYYLESYGCGFVRDIAGELLSEDPLGYQILNRGIGGNRVVDLYARVRADVWNEEPDLISILVGINETPCPGNDYYLDEEQFERVYRMLIEETKARLPKVKMILCEPFVLCADMDDARYEGLLNVRKKGKVVEKLAKEYDGIYYLPLWDMLKEKAEKYGEKTVLIDGVHATVAGAKWIAKEWLKLFETVKENME